MNLEEDLDLTIFTPKQAKEANDPADKKILEGVAEETGFTSREPKGRRRRRKRSPYQVQVNVKCRTDMKPLFQELGDRLNIHDHTTFERSLLALMEKEGFDDLIEQYKEATE